MRIGDDRYFDPAQVAIGYARAAAARGATLLPKTDALAVNIRAGKVTGVTIIEIDARPSDCIAMATQQSAPILDVWDEEEDMTEVLRKMQQEGPDPEQSHEEEES